MAKELDAARKEFAAKMKQFAEVIDGLEKRANDASKGEKKKGAAEMAELVRKHNAKYNEMLQQRMQEEDAARRQLEKEHKDEIADLKSNLGPQVCVRVRVRVRVGSCCTPICARGAAARISLSVCAQQLLLAVLVLHAPFACAEAAHALKLRMR